MVEIGKAIARAAFDATLNRELQDVMQKTKQMANQIKEPAEDWELEHYLTERSKEINRKYDDRYSQLTLVFGRLLYEKRLGGGRVGRVARGQADTDPFFRQIFGGERGRLRYPESHVEVYAMQATLLGTSPPVWRRILVPRETTLRNQYRALQTVTECSPVPSPLWRFGRLCSRPRCLGTDSGDDYQSVPNRFPLPKAERSALWC